MTASWFYLKFLKFNLEHLVSCQTALCEHLCFADTQDRVTANFLAGLDDPRTPLTCTPQWGSRPPGRYATPVARRTIHSGFGAPRDLSRLVHASPPSPSGVCSRLPFSPVDDGPSRLLCGPLRS